MSSKGRKRIQSKLSRINIGLSSVNEPELTFRSTFEDGPPLSVHSSDHNNIDLAKLDLIGAEDTRRRRKCNETLLALEKIQSRIQYTLDEYEGIGRKDDPDINIEVIEDSDQLSDLLSDKQARSKYEQKLAVFIVGYQEKCENLEKVLTELRDFFMESQAGGTTTLLEQVALEEIDLDEATAGLEQALKTAQNSVSKLVGIKKEINQLMAIVAAYPDTNKGRKKMEKALMKAQEEVATFSRNLDEVEANLKKSTEKSSQLQVQLDVKTQECAKLRKTADQVKLLQIENEKLKKENDAMQKSLQQSNEELSDAKFMLMQKSQAANQLHEIQADSTEVIELKAELEQEKAKYHTLVAEMESLSESHKAEIESLRTEHEAEDKEVRGRFEEQLKSLMEEDVFEEEEDIEDHRDEDNAVNMDNNDANNKESPDNLTEEEQEEVVNKDLITNGQEEKQTGSAVSSTASIPKSIRHDMSVELRKEMEEKAKEWNVKEKKMQNQIEDIKAKSRKMIAILQSQLEDAYNKHDAEKEKLKTELEELKEQFNQTHTLNDELNTKLVDLEEEKMTLLGKLQQKEDEFQQMREEAAKNLYDIPSHQESNLAIPKTYTLTQSPHEPQSPLQSVNTMPLVTMEEVMDDKLDSQTLDDKEDLFPSSFGQSFISMDPVPLGSPLQSTSGSVSFVGNKPKSNLQQNAPQLSPPIQYNLSMLGGSRLSHYSSLVQNGTVDHKHPVIIEWGKAYDSIIKFKENLISMLSEHQALIPQLSSSIEELKSVELHPMDKKQEVQGQITEMRFNLVLLLHQIEQTLQEVTGQMMKKEVHEQTSVSVVSDPLTGEVKATLDHLTKKLLHSENDYRREIEKKKDTIVQLSNKVEKLQAEVTQLHRALPSHVSGEDGTIMFTRLDSERNKKALETALEKEKISPTTFSKLTSKMDEYLEISGQRLAVLSQRWQKRNAACKLVQHVQKTYSNPIQAMNITQGINRMEQRRQWIFSANMERLGGMRHKLAHFLTRSLSHVEKQTRLFLIKPTYGNKVRRPLDLITPIPRPFPVPRHYYVANNAEAYQQHRPLTRSNSKSQLGSNVKLIQSFLYAQRQPVDSQKLIDCLNTANSSCSPVSHSRQIRSALSSRHLSTPSSVITTDWQVRTSQVWHKESNEDISNANPKPSFSKMLELDITRYRQPEALLGHVLPNLHQDSNSYTPTTNHQHTPPITAHRCHHTPSPQKLISLPEESSQVSSINSEHQTLFQKAELLPPIEIPSRTNTLIVT